MPSLAEWAVYARWNAALVDEFFAGRYGGRPVYIDLEEDALARVGARVGVDAGADVGEGLVAAVVPTLGRCEGSSLFGSHVRRLRVWGRGDRASPPPVVGVLALQSLVAEGMRDDEDLHATNFYTGGSCRR
jgi:hypothetical protein